MVIINKKTNILKLGDYLEEVIWSFLNVNPTVSESWKSRLLDINKKVLPYVSKIICLVYEQNFLLKQLSSERVTRDSSECLRWWCLLSDPQCWTDLKKSVDFLRIELIRQESKEEGSKGDDNNFLLDKLEELGELEKRLEKFLDWTPFKNEHYFREAVLVYCLNELINCNQSEEIEVIDQFWESCRLIFSEYYNGSNHYDYSLSLSQIIKKRKFEEELTKEKIRRKIKEFFEKYENIIFQKIETNYWLSKKKNQEQRIKNFWLALKKTSSFAFINVFLNIWEEIKNRHFSRKLIGKVEWDIETKVNFQEVIGEEKKENNCFFCSPLILCLNYTYEMNKNTLDSFKKEFTDKANNLEDKLSLESNKKNDDKKRNQTTKNNYLGFLNFFNSLTRVELIIIFVVVISVFIFFTLILN